MHKRLRIEVSGIVQGVGFRPFVYRLANRLQLTGFVNNNSTGVLIEIQGMEEMLWQFLHTLQTAPPPLAKITRVETQFVHPENSSRFNIIPSQSSEIRRTLISPDIATCPDCISDISDLQNRRYAYPFTNCTNCGPRYTIITNIPYDRPNTSMSPFKMCPACQTEYEDPDNRRFHAQPNACAVCGPA
ncbi:MAG: carbamoyltransferase HypF [Calditrichales bacterium]|nr:MAG: carbamoyltransferase HypF [Calditrichales bacterium]